MLHVCVNARILAFMLIIPLTLRQPHLCLTMYKGRQGMDIHRDKRNQVLFFDFSRT